MVWKVCAATIVSAWCVGAALAQGPTGSSETGVSVPVDVPVAMVLGKPITLADLRHELESSGIDADSFVDWGSVLRETATRRLKEQFLRDRGLNITPTELAEYQRILADVDLLMRMSCGESAAAMRQQLDTPGLSPQEHAALVEQIELVERASRGERWPDAATRAQLAIDAEVVRNRLMTEELTESERARLLQELAYMTKYGGLTENEAKIVFERSEDATQRAMGTEAIERWKFNEALYAQYGGRLLFKTDVPEAYDATRMWLEAAEDRGDLAILDPTLVTGFWAYYTQANPESQIVAPTGKEFQRPWWRRPNP